MAELIAYTVHDFAGGKIIGRSVVFCMTPGVANPIPDHWKKLSSGGVLTLLSNLEGQLLEPGDTVGWMGDFDPATTEFTYLAGVLCAPETPVPSGFESRDVAAGTIGVGVIRGRDADGDVYHNASTLTSAARDAAGRVYDEAQGGWEMEVYTATRFMRPMEQGAEWVEMDYWSPVKPEWA